MNVDMSDIIEFALPAKTTVYDHDGVEGDAGSDTNTRYVVILDGAEGVGTTEQLHVYNDEEFLIVNEDVNGDELLIDEAELQQQLRSCDDLQQSILRVPKSELFSEDDFIITEQDLGNLEDLVEEDGVELKYNDSPVSTPPPPPSQVLPSRVSALGNKYPMNKLKNNSQSLIRDTRTQMLLQQQDDDVDEEEEDDEEEDDEELLAQESDDEPATVVKPSDKMMDEFKGPRRYLLFDDLIATIVDFDEDSTPIVEFSMISGAHDEKLPVECGICPDVMHKTKLSKHQKTHLVPGTNRYACIYCTETYRDCKYLAGHARRHMGIRPYVCELCKLYFSTKQDLRVHNQRRHLEKEHICEMCGKTFAQNTQLKRHREATHENKRRFHCQYCEKAYYKNFSLQEHIRNVHMGKRRMLSCPFCGMQCRDAHKMARHRKDMHLNQDSYVCHLCQEEFTDINYFDAHKRSIQCRSNTRRLVKEQRDTPNDIVDDEEAIGMLEDEFDEDAGLLIEGVGDNEIADVEVKDDDCQTHNGTQQFVAQYNYDESQLVENAVDEGLLDDEQYLEMEDIQQHFQPQQSQQHVQTVQYQQQLSQEFIGEDLIYEITLESEDN
ncbi:zinc finger and BTB domain-containing protein 17 [Scaptodrosophila lebanonensis]|uniref:Zinc finger and BTB domain-containing protein 17 n=1 Tax=Drosophila lebanonensis TaxID=7225 RepID=A0A6J2TRG5_DROLE|nr:zinc finger and BTB domain-containing protein 17 [Scaptodrosophila lebanonensis]